ncbi:hypothetical protein [Aestuariispira insulae]|uniref:Uncharacterized protein n=1 Tax=Aestuariispira insulae TaxID=1461337 RepID=A0A3D9HQM8_9PROT|nr:hypothetical protein [Aestuariispira insulae]RED51216.1 hypothetical protein DFP90_10313 [Aestuariispira insulae]
MKKLFFAALILCLGVAVNAAISGAPVLAQAYADGHGEAAKELKKLAEERDAKIAKARAEYERDMADAQKEDKADKRAEKLEKARRKRDEKIRKANEVYNEKSDKFTKG